MGILQSKEEEPAEPPTMASGLSVHESLQYPPKKLRKPLVTILNEIQEQRIMLDPDLVKENNAILEIFLKKFTLCMRECDPTFKEVFNRIAFTGSFYDDLRISKPNEFDLNLILKMPFRRDNTRVIYKQEVASYVKYRLKNSEIEAAKYPHLMKLFVVDGHILPDRVRSWLQSAVAKMLHQRGGDVLPANCTSIKVKDSGPARTFTLTKRNGEVIDIDFVPVVEFTLEDGIPGIDKKVKQKFQEYPQLKCFLVPKPYKSETESKHASPAECKQLWRLHFPEEEKKIIHNLGCAKSVIRLLKLLRDLNDWKILASYYLKTVVMWQILTDKPAAQDWRGDQLGDRFMEALTKLASYVEYRSIPYFFSTPHNLISKMNSDQSRNIANKIKIIIKKINDNHDNLWEIYKVKRTFPSPV